MPGSRIVELALLLARLLLSAVFLLAGVAKVMDRKGAFKALSEFGLPRAFAQPLSALLPVAEIAIAVALVPLASAWYGACAAFALLTVFVAGIGITLARGRKPDCHCFGQLHSSPVGSSTLVRNGILAGLAAWLALRGPAQDGPALWQYLVSAGDDERKLFIFAACILCVLLFRALRRPEAPERESVADDWDDPAEPEPRLQRSALSIEDPTSSLQPHDAGLRRVLQEGAGWPIGTMAPEFTLPDITGDECSLQSLRDRGKPICLVFSSPHCDSCRALGPSLTRWAREYGQTLNLIIVSRGAATETPEVPRVLLQKEFEISDAYGVTATPAALLIGADGRIQSRLAVGRDEINQLISSSARLSNEEAQFNT